MFEFEWKYAQINQERKNSEAAIVERGRVRAGQGARCFHGQS